MFSVFDIVIEIINFLLLALWLFLYFKGNKYKDLIEPLDGKDFFFKEIYGIGFCFMDLIKYNYKSKRDIKLRSQIEILYGGSKYAIYYLKVIYAQSVSIALTLLVFGFSLYGLSGGELSVVLVMLVLAVTLFYYCIKTTQRKILSRSEELLSEFANVVSKLALLTNAGMILHEAWRQVAESGEGVMYDEMKTVCLDMDNGVSESEALRLFGLRCIIPEIKKFTSTVTQGLSKGNAELSIELQKQSKELWMIKKQNVKRQGEIAANKLMLPIVIMFIGILIMVIIPIFANLGV